MVQYSTFKVQGLREENPGLFYALLAMSFFRGRHRCQKKYKRAKPGSRKSREVEDCFEICVQDARMYIKMARLHRFRGSVREAIY